VTTESSRPGGAFFNCHGACSPHERKHCRCSVTAPARRHSAGAGFAAVGGRTMASTGTLGPARSMMHGEHGGNVVAAAADTELVECRSQVFLERCWPICAVPGDLAGGVSLTTRATTRDCAVLLSGGTRSDRLPRVMALFGRAVERVVERRSERRVLSAHCEHCSGLSVQAERLGRRDVLMVRRRSTVRFRKGAPR